MRIDHWKGGRFFALYDDAGELIAVFVYRKGAQAVKDRLEQSQQQEEEHNAQNPTPLLKVINLKCQSERASYEQTTHAVQVESEDAANWYGKPIANSDCGILQWPRFAWKEVKTEKEVIDATSNRGVARFSTTTPQPESN